MEMSGNQLQNEGDLDLHLSNIGFSSSSSQLPVNNGYQNGEFFGGNHNNAFNNIGSSLQYSSNGYDYKDNYFSQSQQHQQHQQHQQQHHQQQQYFTSVSIPSHGHPQNNNHLFQPQQQLPVQHQQQQQQHQQQSINIHSHGQPLNNNILFHPQQQLPLQQQHPPLLLQQQQHHQQQQSNYFLADSSITSDINGGFPSLFQQPFSDTQQHGLALPQQHHQQQHQQKYFITDTPVTPDRNADFLSLFQQPVTDTQNELAPLTALPVPPSPSPFGSIVSGLSNVGVSSLSNVGNSWITPPTLQPLPTIPSPTEEDDIVPVAAVDVEPTIVAVDESLPKPLFMMPHEGVIQIERNGPLGVLVDLVGKGCPHRLQGRSFKILKTRYMEFNKICFELLANVKGKGKRWSENPFKIIRGNKDLFCVVGEGKDVDQFVAMVDEPEVELKESHYFTKDTDVVREGSDEILERILVNQDSELGLVVSVLIDKGETRCGDSWDVIENQLKVELPPSINTFRRPLKLGHKPREAKVRHLKDDVYIGDEFAIHQRDSWTKMYEDKHGDIVEFMAKHKNIFTTPERIEGRDGQNATWHDTDLDLKPNARVMLRQDVKIELVDNLPISPYPVLPAPQPKPTLAAIIQARHLNDFPSTSENQNDTYRLLPKSLSLEAKISEIYGFSVRGDSKTGVMLIRESCPVGVLVKFFIIGRNKLLHRDGHKGKSFVRFGDLDAVLMGDSQSVQHRFPDFSSTKALLSDHQDVFCTTSQKDIDVKRLKVDTKIYLRNHPKSCCVVNDEKYSEICAAAAAAAADTEEPSSITSADRGDGGITLRASSILKTRVEGIVGMSLQGHTPSEDVTVYPESCPVGVLIKAFRTQPRPTLLNEDSEGNTFITWTNLYNVLSGHLDKDKDVYKSVGHRFPGFPGMKPFLSKHGHLFMQLVDTDTKIETTETTQDKKHSRRSDPNVYLINASCHWVISDDQFTSICAMIDDEKEHPGMKQEYLCSLSKQLMIDPVTCADGNSSH